MSLLMFALVIVALWWLITRGVTNRDYDSLLELVVTPVVNQEMANVDGWRWKRWHRYLREVDLQEHHWLRFTFRSPWRLYSKELIDEARRKGVIR